MAAFEYIALNAKGKEEKGMMEADTSKQLRQLLRSSGLIPLEVHEVAQSEKKTQNNHVRFAGKIKPAELALITRQLATLLQSGAPLEEVLATISKQTEKRNTKRIISAVRTRVVEGHSLAAGLKAFPSVFPPLYQATVAAGEKSGHLDAVLERLADYTESRQAMQQKVTGALLYPLVLTLVAIAVLIGLLGFVVPKVVRVFEDMGQELPTLTQLLISVSDFIREYGWLVLIAMLVAVFFFQQLMKIPKWKFSVHRLLLRLPLVGRLVKGFNAARFARTLSILSSSGVPIIEAMTISAEVVQNQPMKQSVSKAAEKVREGASIYRSLEQSGHFPVMMIYMIASGEGSGKLDSMLERAATQQEREADSLLSTMLGLFEPLLIVFMGGMVLIIVLSILLPIFELNQLIGQ